MRITRAWIDYKLQNLLEEYRDLAKQDFDYLNDERQLPPVPDDELRVFPAHRDTPRSIKLAIAYGKIRALKDLKDDAFLIAKWPLMGVSKEKA